MKPFFVLVLFLIISLACGAPLSALPTPTEIQKSSTPVTSVQMVVVAEKLNIRADSNEKSAADPQGLKRGDVVKVYLACTGGQMKDWLAINRDCTRWVKTSWLEASNEPR